MPNELTNPNNVVTEERLAQFYQQILPYLGGMPDILANKFSKADLYSTDEKLIGRWIDGKPIYQLTFKVTGFSSTSRTYKDILDATDLNIEHLIFGYGWNSGSGDVENTLYRIIPSGDTSTAFGVCYRKNTKKIQAVLNGAMESSSNCYAYVTIQYTKTTDSAVEIGDDTDYSTTEKIVGTWINGKPIWQKTLEFVPNAHEYSYNISSLSVETPISVNGIAILVDNTPVTLDYITPVDIRYGIGIGASPTAILVNIGNQRSIPSKVIATIQYTKTSS